MKVPSFLYIYLPKFPEDERYNSIMGNWITIHSYIRALEPHMDSLRTLCGMMFCEYKRPQGARMDIIVRLHGKFTRMRYEVERVELSA